MKNDIKDDQRYCFGKTVDDHVVWAWYILVLPSIRSWIIRIRDCTLESEGGQCCFVSDFRRSGDLPILVRRDRQDRNPIFCNDGLIPGQNRIGERRSMHVGFCPGTDGWFWVALHTLKVGGRAVGDNGLCSDADTTYENRGLQ